MTEKGGNFFEGHIEKIVWAAVGLVCFWLLITRVLLSPNYVSYDNKEFPPGDIDLYISKQAELLEHRLDLNPEPGDTYNRNIGKFIAKFYSAIDIDVRLGLPQPPYILSSVSDNRKYSIPLIGEVNGVAIEHIRAAAYVPTEKIDEENSYDRAKHKPDDIDFVTVESKFDVARLVENFYESFSSDDVQEEWRDPCLGKPVFAAVQLHRQELLADDHWSDWQIVPRTKINHRRRMFEVIEEVEKLPPGGIEVRLLQFDESGARIDLLQPEAYRIASAKEDWFPPSLHKKFVKVQGEIEAQEMREAREAERNKREEEARARREETRTRRDDARPGQRSRSSTTRTTRARPGGRGRGGESGMMGQLLSGMSPGRSPTGRGRSDRRSDSSARRSELEERRRENERLAGSREAPRKTSIDDIYKELDEILITDKTDLTKMRELVFWAHDDTVELEKSYRYKIRLGVFNPIAGTDQFSEEFKSLKNNAILWSEFSEVTETVEIPGRLYFFCRDKHEADKTVTVTVCRYVLGYWYSKDFAVKQGEVIGKVVEPETVKDEKEKDVTVTVPERIDYATGAVLVDVIPVSDWSGAAFLRPRHYFDTLYSFDGTNIEHMPTKPEYWAKELQVQFNEIKKSEKEPKEPLRAWVSRAGRVRQLIPAGKPGGSEKGGGRGFGGGMFEEMFNQQQR